MANSDAAYLEALKTGRDAIVAAIATGQLTVEYSVGRRMVEVEPSTEALERLDKLIDAAENKVARSSGRSMRLAKLRGAC